MYSGFSHLFLNPDKTLAECLSTSIQYYKSNNGNRRNKSYKYYFIFFF